MRNTRIIDVVPPAQSDQQASRDVFHRPKVGGQQQNDEHETGDERIAKPAAQHVRHNGGATEEQVKESDVRMTNPNGWYNKNINCWLNVQDRTMSHLRQFRSSVRSVLFLFAKRNAIIVE